MRTISQNLSENTQELQAPNTSGTSGDRPDTTEIRRIDPEELEKVYHAVPTVYNSINKITQVILSRDRSLVGDNAGYFEEFLENIGTIGGDMFWDEMLEAVYRYQAIYGECYIELIRNDGGEIVDLALLDPKRMDYARNGTTTDIVMDRHGNPMGYTQDLPNHVGTIEQPFEVPDEVSHLGDKIYFPSENIVHFKFNTVGDGFYPIGLVEPIYRAAERSFQLQEDYADKAHSTLFPLRYMKVGDERHEPSPQKIEDAAGRLRGADSHTEMAFAYYNDLDMLEPENPEAMIDFFQQFSDEIITGMGIPKAFGKGAGSNVNRATLQAQSRIFEISMTDFVRRTVNRIERDIFTRVAESNDLGGKPEYQWEKFDPVQKAQVHSDDPISRIEQEFRNIIDDQIDDDG